MGEVGMLHGEMEREELRTYGSNSKSMSKIAKVVLKLTALMGLEPVAVSAQEETCTVMEKDENSSWIWVSLLILACVWAGNMLCGSFQYWRKLEKRLYFNELQQAEDDTLIGKRRNELSSLQTQLSNSRGRFEDHSCGIKSFPENNVNLWQFWRRPTWQFMMADRGNLRTQIHHGAEGHQHLPEHLAQEN